MEEQNEQNEQNEQTVDIGKAQAAALKKGIGGTLLVCVGLVAGAYALGFFNGPASAQATPEESQAVSWKEGAILDGGGFVVNLADRDRARYAKGFLLHRFGGRSGCCRSRRASSHGQGPHYAVPDGAYLSGVVDTRRISNDTRETDRRGPDHFYGSSITRTRHGVNRAIERG